jgi:predicted nuclease of predicted toxin-antitoxin system
MELYADENFPLRVVEELRRLGHDVLTALEDGRANQSLADRDLLARATEINRALLTLNRLDFKRLHFQIPDHGGIVICTEDPDRVGQALRVAAAVAEVGELKGRLIRVYRLK